MSHIRITATLGEERFEIEIPIPRPPVHLDQTPQQIAAALAAAADPVLVRAFSDARALLARRSDQTGADQ